jgi:hypothetical protein
VDKFHDCLLEQPAVFDHSAGAMSARSDKTPRELKQRFRLHFQEGLREYLARNGSAAEGFGIIWERTLERIRVGETAQAELYWELIQWTRSYDLFTCRQERQHPAACAEQ